MPSRLNSLSDIELEKAKNSIDQFLYSCSHNLRSPLKSIEGLLLLLKMSANENGSEEMATLVNALGQTIKRMDETLLGMHEFLLNSNQKVQLHPVLISDVIKNSLTEINKTQRQEEVKVNLEIIEEVPIYTDITRIQVVIRHLLVNAFTFTDDSKREHVVNISLKVNDLRARIVIKDNGIGIDDSLLNRIFDLFFRGSVKSQGAGIGLYLTKEIVKKLDGFIEVQSEKGVGSTFTVSIPGIGQQDAYAFLLQ